MPVVQNPVILEINNASKFKGNSQRSGNGTNYDFVIISNSGGANVFGMENGIMYRVAIGGLNGTIFKFKTSSGIYQVAYYRLDSSEQIGTRVNNQKVVCHQAKLVKTSGDSGMPDALYILTKVGYSCKVTTTLTY